MIGRREIDERFGNTRAKIELTRAEWSDLCKLWDADSRRGADAWKTRAELDRLRKALLPLWRAGKALFEGLREIESEYGRRNAVVPGEKIRKWRIELGIALDTARESKRAKYMPRDRDGNIIPPKTSAQLSEAIMAEASCLLAERLRTRSPDEGPEDGPTVI